MVTLPTQMSSPKEENAKMAVFFGKPKSGKTTLFAQPNVLIIDLEHGTDFLSALKIKANSLEEVRDIRDTLRQELEKTGKYPYEYIAIDTITKLEDMVEVLAIFKYRNTPMGKNFNDNSIKKLPNGAGYLYLREAFFDVLDWFRPLCKGLILIGHANATQINRNGKELSEMDLDLSGKLKRLVAADADAIGYVYRDKNQTIISFEGGEDCIVEARPQHLKGKKIVVAESDDSGKVTTYFDRIYKNN